MILEVRQLCWHSSAFSEWPRNFTRKVHVTILFVHAETIFLENMYYCSGKGSLWTQREVHTYVRWKYHKIAKVDERVKDGHLSHACKVEIVNKLYPYSRFTIDQFTVFTNNTETLVTAFVWCFVDNLCCMTWIDISVLFGHNTPPIFNNILSELLNFTFNPISNNRMTIWLRLSRKYVIKLHGYGFSNPEPWYKTYWCYLFKIMVLVLTNDLSLKWPVSAQRTNKCRTFFQSLLFPTPTKYSGLCYHCGVTW